MFDSFSPDLRTALASARVHALRLGHAKLRAIHMLLALLYSDGSACASVLRNLGVDREDLLRVVESRLDRRGFEGQKLDSFTQPAAVSLRYAIDASREIGNPHP